LIGVDTSAPGAAVIEAVEIVRGKPDDGDSCSDLGWIYVYVRPGFDDVTAPDHLGFQFATEGQLPASCEVRAAPQRGHSAGMSSSAEGEQLIRLVLIWYDGTSEKQDAFRFQLRVRCMDEAGNCGGWSDPYEVAHDGTLDADSEP
jgi:hypothetical protein